MFNFKKNNEIDPLQNAIDALYSALAYHQSHTEEYANIADQIVKLKKLQQESNPSWRPSPDAMVSAAASIGGILMILHYEKVGMIASKALGFVRTVK